MPHYIVRLQVIVEAVNQEAAVNVSDRIVERLDSSSDTEEVKMTSVEITSWKG
jgi:hypothetical protein